MSFAKLTLIASKFLKNTFLTQKSMEISKLLPTPTTGDRRSKNSKQQGINNVIENLNLTSSQEASPANLFPPQASEERRQMTATSGQRCFELYGKQAQLGLLAKMLLESSTWHSNKRVLTWKPKVMKSSRLLFQLAPSTLRTGEIEYGLLPTARANKIGGYSSPNFSDTLEQRINRLLPTARASSANGVSRKEVLAGNPNRRLETEIAMLPTPRVADTEGSPVKNAELRNGSWSRVNGKGMRFGVKTKDAIQAIGGEAGLKLQPNFVEWMMGYPLNWTDLNSPKPSTESKG